MTAEATADNDAFTTDVKNTLHHATKTIGTPDEWAKWPGGWPEDIGAALIDAVFSARAVYRSKSNRGVYATVVAWRNGRKGPNFTIEELIAEMEGIEPLEWARKFGNVQLSPSRPASATGGPSKAATVLQAARMLKEIGVSADADIRPENADLVKHSLRSVPGIGYATANYFLMLLGRPGVKPDRMVHRFLKNATGHGLTNADADQTIVVAAQQLNVKAHELDHAIWKFQSSQGQ